MDQQIISNSYKFFRPDTTVPWHFEYIETTTDPALDSVKEHYQKFLSITNGSTGWNSTFEIDSDPHYCYLRQTYANATTESINHQTMLYYERYVGEFYKWIEWGTSYNAAHSITRTKVGDLLTAKNSILRPKGYVKGDVIDQTQMLDQSLLLAAHSSCNHVDCK